MLVPGPQNCYRTTCAQPGLGTSIVRGKERSCDIGEKAKQNSARNDAKCSKCFQFLCNNSDRTCFFNALTFARSLGLCWKLRPSASVFNTSHGTWRMLVHEKPCLIPIKQNIRKEHRKQNEQSLNMTTLTTKMLTIRIPAFERTSIYITTESCTVTSQWLERLWTVEIYLRPE